MNDIKICFYVINYWQSLFCDCFHMYSDISTFNNISMFTNVIMVHFDSLYGTAQSNKWKLFSYFSIISFFNSIVVFTTFSFSLFASLAFLEYKMITNVHYVYLNKRKKGKHITIQNPEMFNIRDLFCNYIPWANLYSLPLFFVRDICVNLWLTEKLLQKPPG